MLDNSGSMNTIIFPSFYDANHTYVGPGCDKFLPTNTFSIKKFGNQYYFVNYNYESTKLEKLDKVTGYDYVRELNLSDCNGSDTYIPNQGIYFYPFAESQEEPRYPGNLLNFLIYYATPHQLAIWNHFIVYGNWDAGQGTETSTGVYSPAPAIHSGKITDPDINDQHGYNGHDNKIRIKVARKVLTWVMWDIYNSFELDPNLDKKRPRIGITIFEHETDPDGGTLQQKCQDNSVFQAMASNIKGILANSWTPLAETYAETWAYFRHGGQAHITDDKYFLPLDDPGCQGISANRPVTNWCQLNFILILTDGESTKDDYMRTLSNNYPNILINTNKMDTWGDTDDPNIEDDSDTLASNGTNYLDDLAYFAYNYDLYPDEMLENDSEFEMVYQSKQFIYTYAIGFAIDNYALQSTADNGGGEYYTASNYEELVAAFKAAMASIDEKVNAYASFAAPKYSLTYGERRGYAGIFVPKNLQNIWEGHLKCYLLDEDGNFPPDLDNPGSALLWDAGLVLNARIAPREIMTIKDGSLVGFNNTNVTAIDLDFTSGIPAQDDADRDAVINFIRGDNGYDWKLGDIFHFNPIVVGAPLPWKGAFSTSYQDFYDYYTKSGAHSGDGFIRTEVVYVGANDGMLHCLKVENGDELWAFIPPSLLPKLKHSVPDVTDSLNKHNYFVDGKAIVKDVKISNNGDWTDWRTVIIFGMGVGGKTYCALDITNPANPIFLWEFSDSTMGYTEAKPIITQISNDGNGNNFPGVILSGGYNMDELSAPGDLEGKSFFILHAYDGTLIKKFIYGATTSDPDTLASGVYTHTNSGFKYAFTSTPAVLDYNYDGFADYIYMSETGDYRGTNNEGARIWKVNLDGDPITWRPKKIFQADDAQTIFIPPTLGFDQNFNLWVLLGTGHRPKTEDSDNETGQFIGFVDDGTISTPLDNSDFKDITSSFTNPGTDTEFSLTSYKGLYFDYVNRDAEILFEPNPIFLNNVVYFNTYAPLDTGVIDDPCKCSGNQFVYSFKLSSMGSTISIEDTDVFSGKIQGYGSFSGGKFKIYFGSGEAGSSDITNQETIDLTSIFGPLFWLENKI